MYRFSKSRWLAVLILGQFISGAESLAQSLRLRETAEVADNMIALSDLLPAEASTASWKTSAEVGLGSSPKPGSTRVIEAAYIVHALESRPELIGLFEVPDRVLVRRAGFPVRRQAILDAIQRFLAKGNSAIDLGNAPIEWDEQVASLAVNPTLRVTQAVWDLPRQTLRLSMRVSGRDSGPDFLVQVHDPKQHPGFGPGSRSSPTQALKTGAVNALIAEGSRAWLVLEGEGIRMQIEVVCLEHGILGQQIRVLNPNTHQVLHAEVIGPKELRARLGS